MGPISDVGGIDSHAERTPHTASFLKEHSAVVSLVADFLCVKDRLHFLHTHKCVP